MQTLWSKRTFLLAGAVIAALVLVCTYFWDRPRVLAVSEVPIAFWSWRTQAPTEAEVGKAFAAVNGKTLFLRAGQFDLTGGTLQRIRPVSGRLPSSAEIHLVYNGTRKFLAYWFYGILTVVIAMAFGYGAMLWLHFHSGASPTNLSIIEDLPPEELPGSESRMDKVIAADLTPEAKRKELNAGDLSV